MLIHVLATRRPVTPTMTQAVQAGVRNGITAPLGPLALLGTPEEDPNRDFYAPGVLEGAFRAAKLPPSNGGGDWISRNSRITRRMLLTNNVDAIANVYEFPGNYDAATAEVLKRMLLQRLEQNFGGVGSAWTINLTAFDPIQHGTEQSWRDGSAARTRTRDTAQGVIASSTNDENPAGIPNSQNTPMGERAAVEDAADDAARRLIQSGNPLKDLPWGWIGLAVGAVTLIAIAPTLNALSSRVKKR